ncbi:LysM peptidoglycan-binding domain-containing protein [Pedobacter heparinus]|uniref:septal ring lytic transglycosylase RlpA family protein n=1 Tax=Pedobacter heparinus TaxID=984 RepID=UPI002931EFFD|nr:LysM peptidoglycan-binding domain-containing protein [Pedobacter heparinus]
MHKYYIVSVFALLLNLSASAARPRDSIGVENYNGKKLIVHQVVAKDTYYSMGRRYNVVPKDIMTFNDNKFLQIGVIIKIPTNIPFNATATAPGKINNAAVSRGTGDAELTEHVVQKKENLNMLAEKYGTTVNEIKRVNNLNSINLQIGQLLKIPGRPAEQVPDQSAQLPAVQPKKETVQPKKETVQPKKEETPVKTSIPPENRYKKTEQAPAKNEPAAEKQEALLVHTVGSNETIYSIATTYKMTMDQLKVKNNLKDNSLYVGQKLLIRGQYPVKTAHTPEDNPADTLNSIKDPALRYPASRYGLNQMDEKGTGIWIADADLDPSKMLVLHRTAPIGTVMKITNPMTNRSTFAKVVGKFTENESTKDVIIVMTKAVADALGALDKRFYCNLTYGGQDNEQ